MWATETDEAIQSVCVYCFSDRLAIQKIAFFSLSLSLSFYLSDGACVCLGIDGL